MFPFFNHEFVYADRSDELIPWRIIGVRQFGQPVEQPIIVAAKVNTRNPISG